MTPSHALNTRRARRRSFGVVGAALALGIASPAAACVEVGNYRDSPTTLAALDKQVGKGMTVISTYVSVRGTVDPAVIRVAKARKARLMVTLLVDGGKDGPNQRSYSNTLVAQGRYDKRIRTLSRQLKASKLNVILRPMPEPNTQWWAWGGTVNGNSPAGYIAAWKRVRTVVKKNAGKRVKLLWAPYARSIPDTDENAIDQYFPGNDQVDLVGVSGYNFGATGELEWLSPLEIFQDPYIEIQNLSKKAFWIAETGSSTKGGDKAAWIRQLVPLQKSMPSLRGIVLYDVREANGDFRVSTTKKVRAATKALLATRCGVKKKR